VEAQFNYYDLKLLIFCFIVVLFLYLLTHEYYPLSDGVASMLRPFKLPSVRTDQIGHLNAQYTHV